MQRETIQGVVADIVFRNEENGYTVLMLQPNGVSRDDEDGFVTVVGRFVELQPGETAKFTGGWGFHPTYGQQFKADAVHLVTGTSESAESFLMSGQIAGIGKRTAQRILEHFGPQSLEILDNDPSRIAEIPGIMPAHAKTIAASWSEMRRSRKAIRFLQEHGITAALAHQIYDTYGDDTIKTVEHNPYQLAMEIEGVDFKIADGIAQALGLANDAPARIKAGILFALRTLSGEGHVYAPRPLLVETASGLLGVPAELCENAITALKRSKDVEAIKRKDGPSGNLEAVYTRQMYDDEFSAAMKLRLMASRKDTKIRTAKAPDWVKFWQQIAKRGSVELSEQQQQAVQAVLGHNVCVLTGGPGTGKTTTLRAVIQALDSIKAVYCLASPTGRAARRLSEATGRAASTLHRLLGYSPEGGFTYNADFPLETDIVIVDEASMIDVELFARLLDALPDNTHLMLVGDVDQLPSVGPGNVLHDVIDSQIAHVTRLDVIFRQASDSHIVANAHRVNRGEMPEMPKESQDFFLFNVSDSGHADILDLMVDVVSNRIPSKFALDPLNQVQVLAPMYKGNLGIHSLNERLQSELNPLVYESDHVIAGRKFRVGDKVIQTRNNYEKDVYNGDIGRIMEIEVDEQKLLLDMDGRLVEYRWKEAVDLFHAFAISIHRSQGSEYPAVVIPILPEYSRMLQRNLLYTAITRAKQLVVLVGTRAAIQKAVENNKVALRYSGLAWQIQHMKLPPGELP